MQSSSQAVRAKEDGPFLERFIEAHEGFILRTASRHAGHTVTRSDDEYSVALMAFYEAVKGYDPSGGPFGAYASLVIGRRLADYYRASHRFDAEVSLAPQTFDGTVEEDAADAGVQLAVVEKLGEMRTVCAAEEIESADEQFAKYGFSFYDLASCSPKSDKTRCGCGMAAAALSRSSVLAASLRRTHELPVRALAKESGVSARLIERHRNYIVAAALLLDGDYPVLSSYLGSIRRYLHEAEGQNRREAAVCAQS